MSTHDAGRIVTEFCDAWSRSDVDAIVDAFADDAVYHNVPREPLEGKAAIEAFIRAFFDGGNTVVFETHRQLGRGEVVMNERTDYITRDERTVALPLMGVFEVRDGRVVLWKDYFDAGMAAGPAEH